MPATLTPDEIKALMSAIQDGKVNTESQGGDKAQVVPYDLTSQDRIIRGQMPTLDAINEQVASMLGIGLAGRTRVSLRITSSPATLLKFADLVPLLSPPASVCVLGLGASYGFALAVLEAGLAEALLAAALGDRRIQQQQEGGERRELTGVEQLVLRRLLLILTDSMAQAWAPVIPFQPEVLRFELDPRMASIAPPTDVGIVSGFELKGGIEGRLQLVIPYAAVESAKQKLSSPRRLSQRADERFADALAREVEQVTVEIRGIFGRTRIPLTKLLDLEPGHVLLLDTDEGKPIPVIVQGREKLMGAPTVSGGSLALIVDHPLRAPAQTPAVLVQ
jgi:flagellar motor switch protein FliM